MARIIGATTQFTMTGPSVVGRVHQLSLSRPGLSLTDMTMKRLPIIYTANDARHLYVCRGTQKHARLVERGAERIRRGWCLEKRDCCHRPPQQLDSNLSLCVSPHRTLCYFYPVDKGSRYSSLEAMKAAEYRSWQRLQGSERIRAVMDLTLELYAMKGQSADAPKLQRTVIRFQRRAG